MSKWYIGTGPEGDVVISSRIRLARNLADVPFPFRMSQDQRKAVNKKVFAAIKNSPMAGEFNLVDMNECSETQAVSMAEHHLISPDFAANRRNRALMLSHDESVSVMLCEEDHIRLQVMRAGLNLEEALRAANEVDDIIDRQLDLAFDEKLGYLTQCPTNLGTGMRASLMLHLPALRECGQIARLANMVTKLGLTLRGTFGENTSAQGDFYQLSNQVTLGISEKAALENLKSIAMQVVAQERSAREELKENGNFEDKVYRAMGTLRYARKLNSQEFMNLISYVRLGVAMDYFDATYEQVGSLIARMQPATLMSEADANLDADFRDRLRAKLVRETLGESKK